jgi:hypothetical protein
MHTLQNSFTSVFFLLFLCSRLPAIEMDFQILAIGQVETVARPVHGT